jgi:hypothetical protein
LKLTFAGDPSDFGEPAAPFPENCGAATLSKVKHETSRIRTLCEVKNIDSHVYEDGSLKEIVEIKEQEKMTKQLHEETQQERDARHRAEMVAASAPTPEQRKAQRLANEHAHQAAQNFMLRESKGQDRYEASVENAARLNTIIQKMHGGNYTEETLEAALEYGITNKIITPKQKAPVDPNAPKTHAEWAKILGYTTQKIRDTPKARLKQLLADPFHEQIIQFVLANRL